MPKAAAKSRVKKPGEAAGPHDAAVAHLSAADPVLAAVIARVGPCGLRARSDGTHFDAVVRAIIFQQLSGKAATTIHNRMVAHFGNRHPTPAELLAAADEPLRAAGISRQKLGYLRDLAGRAADPGFGLDALHEAEDALVVETLTAVKGVGPWTAQMFLLFRLGRGDVWPTGDLGIRNAVKKAWRMRTDPTPAKLEKLARKWSPYRSVASWYLWRSLDEPEKVVPRQSDAPGPW
jgi:DNA-3-methyladenine glycosylase II